MSSTNKTNNENPNTKLVIPEWIKEEYFQDILQKDHPNFKRIVKFAVIAATGPGENYTSIMVRVNIDIELKSKSKQTNLSKIYFKKLISKQIQASKILPTFSKPRYQVPKLPNYLNT